MQKHAREVARFFRGLSNQTFRSEPAEAMQKRLMKHQDKLFTFINHDDVPWNNNNAENAIKRFARYRDKAGARLTKAGLCDFLVLLSVGHTCRYKEVSFLKFLLSRERDVDGFCEGKRTKRRPPAIEVYPKGFIPPHFRNREKARSKNEQCPASESPEERAVEQIAPTTAEG